MAVNKSPNFNIRYGWATGESGWGGDMNQNLAVLSASGQLHIQSLAFSAPPPTALPFQWYGVNENASGAWAGADGWLALLLDEGWLFVEPQRGWRAFLESQEQFVWYTGSAWVSEASGKPVEGDQGDTSQLAVGQKVYFSKPGQLAPLEKWTVPVDEPMILPSGAQGSLAYCETPGSESFALTLLRNTTEIGAISFAADDFEGTFIVPSAITMGVGDRLSVLSPANPVPGLTGVSLLIRLLFASNK